VVVLEARHSGVLVGAGVIKNSTGTFIGIGYETGCRGVDVERCRWSFIYSDLKAISKRARIVVF